MIRFIKVFLSFYTLFGFPHYMELLSLFTTREKLDFDRATSVLGFSQMLFFLSFFLSFLIESLPTLLYLPPLLSSSSGPAVPRWFQTLTGWEGKALFPREKVLRKKEASRLSGHPNSRGIFSLELSQCFSISLPFPLPRVDLPSPDGSRP